MSKINIVHVLPLNDSGPHSESSLCSCHPTVLKEKLITGGIGVVVVHNSWDGREITERAIDAITDN